MQKNNIIKHLLKGCYEIKINQKKDHRGYFQRLYEFDFLQEKFNLKKIKHINNSFSKQKGTTRGLHYQIGRAKEDKIMKCISGSLDLFILDLRKSSKTFAKHVKIRLSKKKNNMVIVPRGCANGIQTLQNNTEIIYFVTNEYNPNLERGISFFDKKFDFKLSLKPSVISKKDKSWPPYN